MTEQRKQTYASRIIHLADDLLTDGYGRAAATVTQAAGELDALPDHIDRVRYERPSGETVWSAMFLHQEGDRQRPPLPGDVIDGEYTVRIYCHATGKETSNARGTGDPVTL